MRLFHWGTALFFFADFFLFEDGIIHEYIGYTLLGLVLLRVVWGFVGSKYARFSTFFPTRRAIREHIDSYFGGPLHIDLSHNPLGALMVFNLLAVILLICATGMLMTLGGFGESEWVKGAHELLASYAMLSVVLHIAGVVVESRRTGVNLVRSMISGTKTIPDGDRAAD